MIYLIVFVAIIQVNMEPNALFHSCLVVIILAAALYQCEAQKLEPKEKEEDGRNALERLKIEGTVVRPDGLGRSDKYWYANTRIYTETGQTAFIR